MPKNTKLWDNCLYGPMMATVRGTYYGVITRDELDNEFYNLAVRAINTFKFPHISTAYTTFYARRDEDNPNELVITDDDINGIPHGEFVEELTSREIEVILAWMKVYWIDGLLSNSDDFENVYTDSSIKTYSRANLVQQNLNRYKQYRDDAREMESRYSRVSSAGASSIGDINEDEE